MAERRWTSFSGVLIAIVLAVMLLPGEYPADMGHYRRRQITRPDCQLYIIL